MFPEVKVEDVVKQIEESTATTGAYPHRHLSLPQRARLRKIMLWRAATCLLLPAS